MVFLDFSQFHPIPIGSHIPDDSKTPQDVAVLSPVRYVQSESAGHLRVKGAQTTSRPNWFEDV